MASDGSISITADMDIKAAMRQLSQLRRKIADTQDMLQQKRAERTGLEDRLEVEKAAVAELTAEYGRLYRESMAAPASRQADVNAQLRETGARLHDATLAAEQTEAQMRELDADILSVERGLSDMGRKAVALRDQIAESTSAASNLGRAAQEAGKRLEKAVNKIGRMIRRIFVVAMITKALRALGQYLTNIAMSFPEIRKAISEIKGNLLTAIQPAVSRLIPLITTLLNLIVRVSAVVADISAKIFGTTVEQARAGAKALDDQAGAYKKTGSAAKKAGKELAKFDTLNIVGDKDAGGGDTSPVFTGMVKDGLEGIELLVGSALLAVGAVLAFTGISVPLGITLMAAGAASVYAALSGDTEALKRSLEGEIGDIFLLVSGAALVLGAILTFTGANIPLGIALMVIGAAGIAAQVALNWGALKEKLQGSIGEIVAIAGAAMLALGILLVVAGVLPLGITLIVAGAAALAPVIALNWGAIKEKLAGELADDAALISGAVLVLGIILTMAGILPLGIALIAAGAAGLVTVAALNWDKITEALKGPMGKIVAIVSGALLVLGIILTLSGVLPLGIALIAVGAAGLVTVAALNWDKIKDKIVPLIMELATIASAAMLVLGIILVATGVLPLGIALIVAGAAGLVTVAALNWDAIKEKIVDVWDSIKTWWQTHVAPIFTTEWWSEKFSSISEGLKDKIKSGINAAIDLFNRFVDWINDKLHISWDSVSILGAEIIPAGEFQLLTLPKIPKLAQGAVIPPNREFAAVLGDQKHGTNIEAPLDTIVQAFRAAGGGDAAEAIMQMGNLILAAIQNQELAAYLDGELVSRQLYSPMQLAAKRRGNNLIQGVTG